MKRLANRKDDFPSGRKHNKINFMAKFKNAYDAGYDAGMNSPDTNNSHFSWFATKELMEEWSRGNKEGKQAHELLSVKTNRKDKAWEDLGNTLYEMGNEEPQW